MFTALLDTCVLWPSLQRDFLLSLAIQGMYRPIWSSAILDELEDHEVQKLQNPARSGLDRNEALRRATHLIRQMRSAFDDAEVKGWEALEGTYGLPDPDDEHVVAAAHIGHAGAIVTENLKDFPSSCLPPGIEAVRAAEFAYTTVSINPPAALAAVSEIASRSGRHGPILSTRGILATLEDRYELVDAVALMRGVK